jgi:hypothetical protein
MHTETPGSPRNLEQSVSYNEHLMPDPDHQRHGALRILAVGLAGLTCALTVMWLSSYRFYTSLGLDMDAVEGPSVRYTYLRARWPGDGSFRMGGGALLRSLASFPVEPFDLGGTFFQPPRRSTPRSLWNRLGFWWIDEPSSEDGAHNIWVFWVGLPNWLPPLLMGASAAVLLRKSRRA